MTQEGFKRKMTAILSVDIVGYSRLMDDDEANRLKELQSFGVNMRSRGKGRWVFFEIGSERN